MLEDVLLHPELGGGDEPDADISELREQVGERAYRAALREVAHHGDGKVPQAPELLANREKVEERLGGVLADAVAGVDDGSTRDGGGALRRAHFVVAQNDDVRIAVENPNGVFEG